MVNLDKKIFVKNIFLIQYKGISALKEMPSQDSKRSFKKRGQGVLGNMIANAIFPCCWVYTVAFRFVT